MCMLYNYNIFYTNNFFSVTIKAFSSLAFIIISIKIDLVIFVVTCVANDNDVHCSCSEVHYVCHEVTTIFYSDIYQYKSVTISVLLKKYSQALWCAMWSIL